MRFKRNLSCMNASYTCGSTAKLLGRTRLRVIFAVLAIFSLKKEVKTLLDVYVARLHHIYGYVAFGCCSGHLPSGVWGVRRQCVNHVDSSHTTRFLKVSLQFIYIVIIKIYICIFKKNWNCIGTITLKSVPVDLGQTTETSEKLDLLLCGINFSLIFKHGYAMQHKGKDLQCLVLNALHTHFLRVEIDKQLKMLMRSNSGAKFKTSFPQNIAVYTPDFQLHYLGLTTVPSAFLKMTIYFFLHPQISIS